MYASSGAKVQRVNASKKPAHSKASLPGAASGAVLYVRLRRLQGKQCSSCSCSRLTLPSRGQLPGYALQLPLMSNVRRLIPGARRRLVNAHSCFAGRVRGRLHSPLPRLEPDHRSNTTHALAVPGCQIGRLLRASVGRSEARCNASKVGSHCPSRFAGGQRTVVPARKH